MIQKCPSCGKEYRSAKTITVFGCCSHKARKIVDGYLVRIEKPPETAYQPPPPRPDTSNEPGSVLYRILKDVFGVKPKQNCGCNRLRNEMDSLGIDGCQEQFDRLAESLKANAKAYNWLESFSAAITAIRSGALHWLDPFHPWESILRHAIESSRQLKVKDADLDDTKD